MTSCLTQLGMGISILTTCLATKQAFSPPMATASLKIEKTTQGDITSPAGIWFEATDIEGFAVDESTGNGYDPSFHEITYVWTVREAPLPPYQAPQNTVTGWNDANLSYGKKVALVFPTAGTYAIDLWAIDAQGTTATAQTSITVVDPSDIYPETLTICYSNDPSETWADALIGCLQVNTIAAAQNALSNASQPARLLLKRGQSTDSFYISLNTGKMGHLGAWGSGHRPIVRTSKNNYTIRAFQGTPMTQITIADIDFRGEWDSTSETGIASQSPLFLRDKQIGCFYTLHNCIFDGFASVALSTNPETENTVLVSDTVVTNWRDYGIYIHIANHTQSRFAAIGSRLSQHVNALNGGSKNGLHNTHGPLRYTNTSNVYLGVLDLFSRCGWSGLGTDTADQPCLRINNLGEPNRNLTIDRVVAEGGFRVASMGGQNGGASGTIEHAGNYVLDKVLFIATAKTIGPFTTAEFGGTTLRNVIGIVPDVLQYHQNNDWPGGMTLVPDNPHINNQFAPMAIHNTTLINLRGATHDQGTDWILEGGAQAFDTQTFENNLLHAPDLLAPVQSSGLDLTAPIPGVTPRYNGVRFNFEGQSGNFTASIEIGQSFSIPYAEITTDLVRQTGGSPTTQSYWLQIPDADHLLIVKNNYDNPISFAASNGDFIVTFETNAVRVTNTSDVAWHTNYRLRLDRSSLIPAMQSQYATPQNLPLPRLSVSSGTYMGMRSYSDFMNDIRPGPGSHDHKMNPRVAPNLDKPGAILEH